MSDTDKTGKDRVGMTKAELIPKLQAQEAKIARAETAGAMRKQAEETLYEFEERYRNLIGGSIQGIFVHRDWKLLFANQSFANMLGYPSVTALMKLGDISQTFAPYEIDRLTVFRDARKRGGRVPTQYEYDAVCKDGTIVTLLNIARVVKWEGETAIQNAVVDISDRKQAEQRVLDEKERAENYLAIAGTMIVALNPAGTVTLVNRKGCEMLGYDLIELLGTNWIDMVIPEEAQAAARRDGDAIIGGKTDPVQHLEREVVTKSGERRLID